jgi:hypothetical protein
MNKVDVVEIARMGLCLGTFLFCFITINTIIRKFSNKCIEGVYEQVIILFGLMMYGLVALAAIIKFYIILNHDSEMSYELSFSNMFVDFTILLYLVYLFVQRIVFKKIKRNERTADDYNNHITT